MRWRGTRPSLQFPFVSFRAAIHNSLQVFLVGQSRGRQPSAPACGYPGSAFHLARRSTPEINACPSRSWSISIQTADSQEAWHGTKYSHELLGYSAEYLSAAKPRKSKRLRRLCCGHRDNRTSRKLFPNVFGQRCPAREVLRRIPRSARNGPGVLCARRRQRVQLRHLL